MVKIVIVNVVSTANLQQKLDLYDLEQFKEILHDTEIYGGRVAYFKIPAMEGKVSIFPSGKMISVGTKSEAKAAEELSLAKDFLVSKKLINPVQLEPQVQNIVAMAQYDGGINLEELAKACKMIYEPEQFPGGILRISNPYKATILIFASGKTVIAGLTNSQHIKPVTEQLAHIIRECSS